MTTRRILLAIVDDESPKLIDLPRANSPTTQTITKTQTIDNRNSENNSDHSTKWMQFKNTETKTCTLTRKRVLHRPRFSTAIKHARTTRPTDNTTHRRQMKTGQISGNKRPKADDVYQRRQKTSEKQSESIVLPPIADSLHLLNSTMRKRSTSKTTP